jgi:hypothetical protein
MYHVRSPERQRHAGLETAAPGAGTAAAVTNDLDTPQKNRGRVLCPGKARRRRRVARHRREHPYTMTDKEVLLRMLEEYNRPGEVLR